MKLILVIETLLHIVPSLNPDFGIEVCNSARSPIGVASKCLNSTLHRGGGNIAGTGESGGKVYHAERDSL